MSINIYKKTSPESYLIIINKPNHDDPICGCFELYNYCFSNEGKELSVKVFMNAHHREYKIFLNLQDVPDVTFSLSCNLEMLLKCLKILDVKYTQNKNKHFKNRHLKDAKESLSSAIDEIVFNTKRN